MTEMQNREFGKVQSAIRASLRRVVGACGLAVTVGLGVLVAPPAHADTDVDVACVPDTSTDTVLSETLSVQGGESVVFSLTLGSCSGTLANVYFHAAARANHDDGSSTPTKGVLAWSNNSGASWTVIAPGYADGGKSSTPYKFRYTAPSDGTTTDYLSFIATDGGGIDGYNYTVTVTAAPTSSVESPVIPAWVQAYGRFGPDATCDEGWGPSWQSWAEDVTGGWVCTRTIPSLG